VSSKDNYKELGPFAQVTFNPHGGLMKCVLHIHFTKVVYKDTLDLLSLCR